MKGFRGSLRRSIGLAPLVVIGIGLNIAFLIYPVVQSIILSFTNRSLFGGQNDFVGFANYIRLWSDPDFLASLRFTFIVVIAVTVISNVLGLGFALLLNRTTRNYRIMRTIVFVPQVLSGVVVAYIWQSILTSNGLLNQTLLNLHIVDKPISWIGTPTLATLAVIAVVSWVSIAFATVVYTASLQSVPTELYEAARADGAGPVRRFRAVTLPMIAPGVTINVVLAMITSFKSYDVLVVLTGGGPANSTKSTAYYLIGVAFVDNRYGYASAIAIVLLALTALTAYGMTWLLRRREVTL